MLSPSLAYADRAPEDLDTNYEPARNQVIDTLPSQNGGSAGATEEEVAAQAAAAQEAASAEASASEKDKAPAVSPEVVQAEALHIGAWFVENDKAALKQAREAAAETNSRVPATETENPIPEETSGMTAGMQPAIALLAGAVVSGILAAVLLRTAHQRTVSGNHFPINSGKPMTEKTVR